MASSKVICFRVSISVVGRTPITGNRKTQITLVPSDSTRFETLEFNPLITDEITITVITPITIPRIVSPLRSLFARSVFSAIVTVSFVSAIRIIDLPGRSSGPASLRPQRDNRIQLRCLPRRIDTEEDSRSSGHYESGKHAPQRNSRGKSCQNRNCLRYQYSP